MKCFGLVAGSVFCAVLAVGAPALGQGNDARKHPTINRNLEFERKIADRYAALSAVVTPEAAPKLRSCSRTLIGQMVKARAPRDLSAAAKQAVRAKFPLVNRAQSDLLTFYVMADVARIAELLLTDESIDNERDSLSELGETESLRLQMYMDRYSKFMTMLSNILKKIADTNNSVIQNLK